MFQFYKKNPDYIKTVSFINQLMHSIDTVVDVKICVV